MLRVSILGLPVCEFPLCPIPPFRARYPKEGTIEDPQIGRLGKSTAPQQVPSLPISGLFPGRAQHRKTRNCNSPATISEFSDFLTVSREGPKRRRQKLQ